MSVRPVPGQPLLRISGDSNVFKLSVKGEEVQIFLLLQLVFQCEIKSQEKKELTIIVERLSSGAYLNILIIPFRRFSSFTFLQTCLLFT